VLFVTALIETSDGGKSTMACAAVGWSIRPLKTMAIAAKPEIKRLNIESFTKIYV
jgi:hypothetical protein